MPRVTVSVRAAAEIAIYPDRIYAALKREAIKGRCGRDWSRRTVGGGRSP